MNNFIYVFNDDDKELLNKQGFKILKDDMPPYIFKNDNKINFSDIKFVFRDEMLF